MKKEKNDADTAVLHRYVEMEEKKPFTVTYA